MIVLEKTLMNESQGERGEQGGRKGYEILVERNDISDVFEVTLTWGKAEVRYGWQSQVKIFNTQMDAMAFALSKFYAKLDKGYEEV